MGETEMENEIRQEVFGNWRTVFTREGYKESVVCRVCGNDKTVCEATERDCKENSKI
jgi:hypothetical protein